MTSCIFCQIARKESPCILINETDRHMAIMDIFPPTFNDKITMPSVLVITKKHLGSNIFEDLDEEEYAALLKYTRKIAQAIQTGLKPKRVCLVFEGMEINHIHAKLYPIFLDSYPGFLSTEKSRGNKDILAPRAVLEDYANLIKKELNYENPDY